LLIKIRQLLFSWQPWHSKQLDSRNWANAVCDRLELGPVMSCIQARCFKPLSFTDAIVTDMNNYEVGKVMDDWKVRDCRKPVDLNYNHSHDLVRFNNFVDNMCNINQAYKK